MIRAAWSPGDRVETVARGQLVDAVVLGSHRHWWWPAGLVYVLAYGVDLTLDAVGDMGEETRVCTRPPSRVWPVTP